MRGEAAAKKMMFVGESFSGKSSLIRLLSAEQYHPRRGMAVEYHGPFINTPGEFLENRRFYQALITSSTDCDILAFVQDATRTSSLFPPLFASMFNRRVVGIVSKVDHSSANIERARKFLANAGVKELFCLSIVSGEGIRDIQKMLEK